MQTHSEYKEKIQQYAQNLERHLQKNYQQQEVKYLDLGTQIVRLVNYSKEFTPHIEKQLTYILKDESDKYDVTLVAWREEEEIESLLPNFEGNSDCGNNDFEILQFFDNDYSKHKPLIDINLQQGTINFYNKDTNTYYYGVNNLNPEEFIKNGHIFVKIFNNILKTPATALIHGAVIGLENQGVLLCAKGQRGKSTLAISAMLSGFEYVSDDYLTLSKENGILYSYPIYSIITLSPNMYGKLYHKLDGKFVSNNARKDKYVINIEKYHDKFKKRYPIKLCMFPQIVEDETPSIEKCKKGQAITHLVHSTTSQMQDNFDSETVKKLINFIKDFEFYQINLCSDIWANVQCLKDFMIKLKEKGEINDKLCTK